MGQPSLYLKTSYQKLDAFPFLDAMHAVRHQIRTRMPNPNPTPMLQQTNKPPMSSHLVLSRASLGELKEDTAASQAPVDLLVGVEPVVDTATLLLVKDDLEGLGAILLGPEALADNLDGVDEVRQDGIVHSRKSARTGALLLLGVARAGRPLGAGEDAARGED